jgi:molecular chaperone GrpE
MEKQQERNETVDKTENLQKEDNIKQTKTSTANNKKDSTDEKEKKKKKKPDEKEVLKNRIKELENEVSQLKNDYLKERADLENTKKRLEKERVIERKYAAMSVAKAFISSLDHFELALKHQPKDEEAKSFVQGFQMILNEIKKGLEDVGVSEIDAEAAEYDPNFHQAVMVEKKEGVEPNKVIEVLQKGYMFKDRVIRPAMVKISE